MSTAAIFVTPMDINANAITSSRTTELMAAMQSGQPILGSIEEGEDQLLRTARMYGKILGLELKALLIALAYHKATGKPVTMRSLRRHSLLDLKEVRLSALSLMNSGFLAVEHGRLALRMPAWDSGYYLTEQLILDPVDDE